MAAPAGRTRYVGRRLELSTLRQGLQAAVEGRGGLALITGEPGIGKTRLAEEMAAEADALGVRLCWGRCSDDEGAPAYWPWLQILRECLRDPAAGRRLAAIGVDAATLAPLLPNLPHTAGTSPALPDPAQRRFQLFDVVTSFLIQLAAVRPLLLVFDDLHRADRPSVSLLRFLTQDYRDARLFVLVTTQNGADAERHPAAADLAALARDPTVRRISLGGLSDDDIARMMDGVTGRRPSAALAAAVKQQTEGNPFFIEEVARQLAAEGLLDRSSPLGPPVRLPRSVREAAEQRLDRLSEPCRRVLTVAAVTGREFGVALLERVTEISRGQLLEALDEAERERVIMPAVGTLGRFRFGHAVLRAALYDTLTAAQRVHLHAQIAHVLEVTGTGDAATPAAPAWQSLAELARHLVRAAPGGDIEAAVDCALRAAMRAAEAQVYEEAAALYEEALHALRLAEPVDQQRLAQLLVTLGEMQHLAGEGERADETLRQAVEASHALGTSDPSGHTLLARAALSLGGTGVIVGVPDPSLVTVLEQALNALGTEDSVLRVRLLGRLAMALHYSGMADRRAALVAEARAAAERLDDPAAVADALVARRFALRGPQNLNTRRAVSDEIVRLSATTGDVDLGLLGRSSRIVDLLEGGDLPAVDVELEELERMARQWRRPYYLWQWDLRRAMRALLDGRLADGERLAHQALALGRRLHGETAGLNFGLQNFWLRRELAQLDRVERTLRGSAYRFPSMSLSRVMLAVLFSDLGRPDEARQELGLLAAGGFRDIAEDAGWLATLTWLAEVAAALDEREAAAALYDHLEPHAQHLVVAGSAAICTGTTSRFLGLLATTLGRWDAAEEHLDDALAIHQRLGARALVAQTRLDQAAMLARRGDPGTAVRAIDLAQAAHTEAEQMGLARLAANATKTIARLEAMRGRGRLNRDGLTPREIEVLQALAAGDSNKEIARALNLTLNTVERHLLNIYRKIGARGRTDAMGYAVRHNLTTPSQR